MGGENVVLWGDGWDFCSAFLIFTQFEEKPQFSIRFYVENGTGFMSLTNLPLMHYKSKNFIMSTIIPELELTYEVGVTPRDYHVNVHYNPPQNEDYDIIDDLHSQSSSPVSHHVIEIDLPNGEIQSIKKKIRLGNLNLSDPNGVVLVVIKQGTEVRGNGTVRVEEAQQESRPFEV